MFENDCRVELVIYQCYNEYKIQANIQTNYSIIHLVLNINNITVENHRKSLIWEITYPE